MYRRLRLLAPTLACCLATSLSCNTSGRLHEVSGTASVDGAPVELGTIHFRPAESPAARGPGGAVNAGQFQLPLEQGLAPGKYAVALQASRSTGRTFKDPQRGDVPIMQDLALIDSPQEVEVTPDNAARLELNFSTAGK